MKKEILLVDADGIINKYYNIALSADELKKYKDYFFDDEDEYYKRIIYTKKNTDLIKKWLKGKTFEITDKVISCYAFITVKDLSFSEDNKVMYIDNVSYKLITKICFS